jgi:hypothetical protein
MRWRRSSGTPIASRSIRFVVCVTAQHREMLDQVACSTSFRRTIWRYAGQPDARAGGLGRARASRRSGGRRADWCWSGRHHDGGDRRARGVPRRVSRPRQAGLRSGDRFQPFPGSIARRQRDRRPAPGAHRARPPEPARSTSTSRRCWSPATPSSTRRWVAEHRRDRLSRVALRCPTARGPAIFMTASSRELRGAARASPGRRDVAQRSRPRPLPLSCTRTPTCVPRSAGS